MDYIVSARLTQSLQARLQSIQWWALEPGLEIAAFGYQAQSG